VAAVKSAVRSIHRSVQSGFTVNLTTIKIMGVVPFVGEKLVVVRPQPILRGSEFPSSENEETGCANESPVLENSALSAGR
jgi:hypothetical protein